jgi:hypothetical protein
MRALVILLLLFASAAQAQVYRWVDRNGMVYYSDKPAPSGVKSTTIDIDARTGPPSEDSRECYSVRCQGERMEERVARREEADARAAARRPPSPPPPHGLSFSKYLSIQRGMTEGEMFGYAGAADLQFRDRSFVTYTWLPTATDPFTTTVTLVRGRVSEIERTRKF